MQDIGWLPINVNQLKPLIDQLVQKVITITFWSILQSLLMRCRTFWKGLIKMVDESKTVYSMDIKWNVKRGRSFEETFGRIRSASLWKNPRGVLEWAEGHRHFSATAPRPNTPVSFTALSCFKLNYTPMQHVIQNRFLYIRKTSSVLKMVLIIAWNFFFRFLS